MSVYIKHCVLFSSCIRIKVAAAAAAVASAVRITRSHTLIFQKFNYIKFSDKKYIKKYVFELIFHLNNIQKIINYIFLTPTHTNTHAYIGFSFLYVP